MAAAWKPTAEGVLVFLRVTPNAGRDVIEGMEQRADGSTVLRLRIAAVPDRGRANAAAVALLARALGVPRSSLRITAGETARLKTIAIAGDPAELAARLAACTAVG